MHFNRSFCVVNMACYIILAIKFITNVILLMKRSRKNRTGLWLEENERDEIEHIIDEMNPTKLQREDIDPDESEDFQVNFLNINILF